MRKQIDGDELLKDWRTKGAYRPIELEAPSSDEPQTEAPCDNALTVSDGGTYKRFK